MTCSNLLFGRFEECISLGEGRGESGREKITCSNLHFLIYSLVLDVKVCGAKITQHPTVFFLSGL